MTNVWLLTPGFSLTVSYSYDLKITYLLEVINHLEDLLSVQIGRFVNLELERHYPL